MILLYHYTSLRNMRAILKSGWIEKGSLATATGRIPDSVVNLTTDDDPAGHGLPDGRPVPDEAITRMPVTGQPGAYRCVDHTKCRLAVEIDDDDPLLISAAEQHASDDGVLFALEVNGWNPTSDSADVALMVRTQDEMNQGRLKNKSSTWWYYFERIPIDKLAFVELNEAGQWLRASVEEAKSILEAEG